ncbi:MAG: hypothetical protein JWM16_1246 [Verrucomicrobiales bacterium]|nr:hypothetical protein [Verrucomicrobiales bacterium]
MDPNVPKMQFNETTIPLIREHFRLVAEVHALRGWVREMWLESQHEPGTDATEARKNFDRDLNALVEQTFAAMLENLEKAHPRLAALLDNRDIGEA